jgi:hypothetical protein
VYDYELLHVVDQNYCQPLAKSPPPEPVINRVQNAAKIFEKIFYTKDF